MVTKKPVLVRIALLELWCKVLCSVQCCAWSGKMQNGVAVASLKHSRALTRAVEIERQDGNGEAATME